MFGLLVAANGCLFFLNTTTLLWSFGFGWHLISSIIMRLTSRRLKRLQAFGVLMLCCRLSFYITCSSWFSLIIDVCLINYCFLARGGIWPTFLLLIFLNLNGNIIFARRAAFSLFVYQRNVIIAIIQVVNLFILLIDLVLIWYFFWRWLCQCNFWFLYSWSSKGLLVGVLRFVGDHALLYKTLKLIR
jgi:hypothetical protein